MFESELKTIKISEENKIKVNGRTVDNRDPVTLIWSGSSLEMNITASELYILAEGPFENFENWIAIEINGEIISRRPLNKEKEWIQIFRMMDPTKEKHVRIITEVQAMNPDAAHCINYYEIKTDGTLSDVPEKPYKFEFIGDSITSGEGCMGAHEEMDWISMVFSHTNSYPYLVSKKLNADYRVFSQSGWGVSRSWNNIPTNAIPLYYEDICSLIPDGELKNKGFDKKNDFEKWQPDAIIINLGTNDNGAFNNDAYIDENGISYKFRSEDGIYNREDVNHVKNSCKNFLKTVRKNNPKAHIFWAYGLLEENLFSDIKDSITEYNNKNNDEVVFIELNKTEGEGFGSRLHPGIISHNISAEIIEKAVISKLN